MSFDEMGFIFADCSKAHDADKTLQFDSSSHEMYETRAQAQAQAQIIRQSSPFLQTIPKAPLQSLIL